MEDKILLPFHEPKTEGDIECNERLAGILKFYYRKAS